MCVGFGQYLQRLVEAGQGLRCDGRAGLGAVSRACGQHAAQRRVRGAQQQPARTRQEAKVATSAFLHFCKTAISISGE
jgi:hypothetical protein